ncbi:MAG: class I SAM-dependent methyltransferase, partial [Methylocella sp.]
MAEETHFGFSRLPLQDKQARVDAVFHKVASRYDLMNDLMSGGLHRIWKDIFVSRVKPSRKFRFRHLDVAGGTGDIAFRVAKAGSPLTEVVVLDINAGMLEEGRRRAAKRHFDAALAFVEANA